MTDQLYRLRLYVSGTSTRSADAIRAVKGMCEEHLQGRYELKVIDIYQSVVPASDGVVAVPTLVKDEGPGPRRKIIGDFSDPTRLLREFGLLSRPA